MLPWPRMFHSGRLAAGPPLPAEKAEWARAQDGRSALYLLCDSHTVDEAETLIWRIWHPEPQPDGSRNDEVISFLRDLVRKLRLELGAE